MSDVYLNGEFVPVDQACVSPLDRGFLFGDGVYEVIPVFAGHIFRLDDHLRRLDNSLNAIGMIDALDTDEWGDVLDTLVDNAGGGDLNIYLQITRGAPPARDHAWAGEMTPTVFAMSMKANPLSDDIRAQGIAATTAPDIRWQRCDIKTIALLPNVMARIAARDEGAAEAILIRDGRVTECAASNVFAVVDDVVVTPPANNEILHGITRQVVLELMARHGTVHEERVLTEEELRRAQEIWATNSTREILPVTRLDGQAVGEGVPGLHWQRIHEQFQAYKAGL